MTTLPKWRLFPALVASLAAPIVAPAASQEFTFTNLTDHPDGPGTGHFPSINDRGDVAFMTAAYEAYVYYSQSDTFVNLNSLPGAPSQGWYAKVNASGNVAFVDPGTRDLWLYEVDTHSLTHLSGLAGYPGNSGSHSLNTAFDLNDANQVSFHSGNLNFGDIYVYSHGTGQFTKVTDRAGAPTRGRDNAINNAGQVAYSGFPDIYVFHIASGTTTNITDLPGGPGTGLGSFSFNDEGDVAIFRSDSTVYYRAATGLFLDVSSLPGYPAGAAASNANDISNRGEITFWRDAQYYFEPARQTFTRLNGRDGVPSGGLSSSINERGVIAFGVGPLGADDVYLATPVAPARPMGLRISPAP